MTTQNLPGTDAARHGTGDADLTIMLAAHDAFRRDLTRLVRAAAAADLSDPARRRSVAAGWELFKHELHLHHTAEDEVIWPVLRPRLAHSEHALSVLDAMEEEHERIDPLLAAVDAAFAQRREDSLADVIDALVTTLTGHLAHEERDGLPLIGVALTAAEWRNVGFKIARRNGLSEGGEMFAWILDGADGRPRRLHHRCRHPAHPAAPAAPALPGRLEAPLQQNPTLVTHHPRLPHPHSRLRRPIGVRGPCPRYMGARAPHPGRPLPPKPRPPLQPQRAPRSRQHPHPRAPNHHDVTLPWSGPRRCGIAVVLAAPCGPARWCPCAARCPCALWYASRLPARSAGRAAASTNRHDVTPGR